MTDDPDRVPLDTLAPRPAWIAQLPDTGRAAAARIVATSWTTAVPRASRWFVPLAAGVAAACWLVSARLADPPAAQATWLVTGSTHDLVTEIALGGAP